MSKAFTDEHINIKVQKSQSRFKRVKNTDGADQGIGNYFLALDITAKKETIYLPISIASGKKPTGFVYQIEGTSEGKIVTTDISCRGEGITQIRIGTVLYCKIPVGVTALFRIQNEIKGKIGKTYKIVITRLNYKLDPNAARYKQFITEINSDNLRFH
jgi:hypothetical protein